MLGQVQIEVHHSTHKAQFPLIILRGTGPTLMGCDWQQILNATANPTLANVLQTHQKLFQGGLGTFKKIYCKYSCRSCH